MQTAPKQLFINIKKKYYAIIIKLNSAHIKQKLNLQTLGGYYIICLIILFGSSFVAF